jgi:hypothetical protein
VSRRRKESACVPRESPPQRLSNRFTITSLTDPTTELPWNHIVAKNRGEGVRLLPQPISPAVARSVKERRVGIDKCYA